MIRDILPQAQIICFSFLWCGFIQYRMRSKGPHAWTKSFVAIWNNGNQTELHAVTNIVFKHIHLFLKLPLDFLHIYPCDHNSCEDI